ncbi:hypothetical protein D9758_005698 [Tetrapyrgos nigripes]|uniref:Uncharacterized protein n=1 Tax=Tetrapyrgos nigripes TaxID=182062 RepID=A0A8H5GJQ2_9AGAR|nr:hypothetical protein D9758_005698 [Tetrapyrgos nigripes]
MPSYIMVFLLTFLLGRQLIRYLLNASRLVLFEAEPSSATGVSSTLAQLSVNLLELLVPSLCYCRVLNPVLRSLKKLDQQSLDAFLRENIASNLHPTHRRLVELWEILASRAHEMKGLREEFESRGKFCASPECPNMGKEISFKLKHRVFEMPDDDLLFKVLSETTDDNITGILKPSTTAVDLRFMERHTLRKAIERHRTIIPFLKKQERHGTDTGIGKTELRGPPGRPILIMDFRKINSDSIVTTVNDYPQEVERLEVSQFALPEGLIRKDDDRVGTTVVHRIFHASPPKGNESIVVECFFDDPAETLALLNLIAVYNVFKNCILAARKNTATEAELK